MESPRAAPVPPAPPPPASALSRESRDFEHNAADGSFSWFTSSHLVVVLLVVLLVGVVLMFVFGSETCKAATTAMWRKSIEATTTM